MATSESLFYNALALSTTNNYKVLASLREKYATWEEAWHVHRQHGGQAIDPEAAWHALHEHAIRLVLQEDRLFPPLLREIPWAPFGIYYRGTLPPETTPSLALVGTRKATGAGTTLARRFGNTLGKNNVVVVSGLALGVDAAAHTGCLDARGITLAVLANGLEEVYPRHHKKLAEQILEAGGALISEYPVASPPLPHRFIERNRIVSGLSRGVVVVEAPEGSGALATARFALEQNRDVFVVPGPATSPQYRGSHSLIRSGATLVTSAEEVLEDLGIMPVHQTTALSPETEEEARVLAVLKERATPVPVDKIIELSKLETQVVTRTLSLLLLKNGIKENAEGYTL